MPRWEPDVRERLVTAALRLFSEQGYDNTTVAEIADSAGLTRSTFFRHFPGKREVLAAGQETLARLFTTGIVAALAGDIGMLAFKEAYAEWVREENQEDLAELLRSAMCASPEGW
jgi:AcrR family transcriptional regulator